MQGTRVRETRVRGAGGRDRHRRRALGRVAHCARQPGGKERRVGVHLGAGGDLSGPVQVDADDRVDRFSGRSARAVHDVVAVLGHGVSRAGAVVRHPDNDRPGSTIRPTLPIGLHLIAGRPHGA
jgi:hypothetical protein